MFDGGAAAQVLRHAPLNHFHKTAALRYPARTFHESGCRRRCIIVLRGRQQLEPRRNEKLESHVESSPRISRSTSGPERDAISPRRWAARRSSASSAQAAWQD